MFKVINFIKYFLVVFKNKEEHRTLTEISCNNFASFLNMEYYDFYKMLIEKNIKVKNDEIIFYDINEDGINDFFVDKNQDGINDDFTDADGNGINDLNNLESFRHGFGWVDEDGNGINDNFTDADGDLKNDITGVLYEIEKDGDAINSGRGGNL